MDPVKVGIIGCGVIGTNHLESAEHAPMADVIAVADLIPERGREKSGEFDVGKVYVEGDDLLEDPDIEAVVLATPAHARFSLALHAFKAGKHVLTEKPVAMNADQVRQMIEAKGDLAAAFCSSRYSSLPSSRAAADLVASARTNLSKEDVGYLAPLDLMIEEGAASGERAYKVFKQGGGIDALIDWLRI